MDGSKGTVWFCDGGGQVLQGKLIDYDRDQGTFLVQAPHAVPRHVTVVVILKNGDLFPTGKAEWCGNTVRVDASPPGDEGVDHPPYLYRLKHALS